MQNYRKSYRKRYKMSLIVAVFVLVVLLAGCAKTNYKGSQNIIEASELADLLKDSQTVVIDARSKEAYEKGHLEGAIHLEASRLSVSEPVAGLIATQEQVEATLSTLGILPESKVYIYDDSQGVFASRIWWVLKSYGHETVKVINQGEQGILKAKLPLTLEVPVVSASSYKAQAFDSAMYATMDDVKAIIDGKQEGKILDVRSLAEYDEGAIKGAILKPHTTNQYTDGSFRSAQAIYLDYHDLGFEKEDNIILYCKTSFRATQTAILMQEAGFKHLKIYDGAWVEWSSQEDAPMEEKDETKVKPSSGDGS